jgi:hypothetical protein
MCPESEAKVAKSQGQNNKRSVVEQMTDKRKMDTKVTSKVDTVEVIINEEKVGTQKTTREERTRRDGIRTGASRSGFAGLIAHSSRIVRTNEPRTPKVWSGLKFKDFGLNEKPDKKSGLW